MTCEGILEMPQLDFRKDRSSHSGNFTYEPLTAEGSERAGSTRANGAGLIGLEVGCHDVSDGFFEAQALGQERLNPDAIEGCRV